MGFSIGHVFSSVVHGVEDVGHAIKSGAQAVQKGVDTAVTALEHTPLGDNVVGHFLGGAVEGAVGAVTSTVSLGAGLLDGSTEAGVAHFIEHPVESTEKFGKGLVAAFKADPAQFLGEIAGGIAAGKVLIPGAGAAGEASAAEGAAEGALATERVAAGLEGTADVAEVADAVGVPSRLGDFFTGRKSAPGAAEVSKQIPGNLLNDFEHGRLQAVMNADTPVSRAINSYLDTVTRSPLFKSMSPLEQRAQILDVFDNTALLPDSIYGDYGFLARRGYTVHQAGEGPISAGEGASFNAKAFRVDVAGNSKPIPLLVDQTPRLPHLSQFTEQQISQVLADLRPEVLENVDRVVLRQTANPADTYWAHQYNEPGFESFMTAGGDGVVTVYPTSMPVTVSQLPAKLSHEIGHIWAHRTLGRDPVDPGLVEWAKAMTHDRLAPSRYATKHIGEDVAESVSLYLSTRYTPLFEQYRTLYPERFNFLDRQFPQPVPLNPPWRA